MAAACGDCPANWLPLWQLVHRIEETHWPFVKRRQPLSRLAAAVAYAGVARPSVAERQGFSFVPVLFPDFLLAFEHAVGDLLVGAVGLFELLAVVGSLLGVYFLEDKLVLFADVQQLLLPDQEHRVQLVLPNIVVHSIEVYLGSNGTSGRQHCLCRLDFIGQSAIELC